MYTGYRVAVALWGLLLMGSGIWGILRPGKADESIARVRDEADPLTKRAMASQWTRPEDLRQIARVIAVGLMSGGLIFLACALLASR